MAKYSPRIIYPNDLNHLLSKSDPNHPENPIYDYRLLAEGDSWFTVGGLPIDNVLKNLKFDK